MKIDKDLKEKIDREIPQDDSTSDAEKHFLMELIRKNKSKVIVEIGTHRAKTAVYMAVAAAEVGGHVHTFDPYEWGARGNVRKFDHLPVTYYEQKGTECQLENIDLVFCDGYHEKRYVLEEIDHFLPRLSENGVIVFHDTNGSNPSCDVPGAIKERNLTVEYIKTENGLAIYENKRSNAKHKTAGAGNNPKKSRKSNVK